MIEVNQFKIQNVFMTKIKSVLSTELVIIYFSIPSSLLNLQKQNIISYWRREHLWYRTHLLTGSLFQPLMLLRLMHTLHNSLNLLMAFSTWNKGWCRSLFVAISSHHMSRVSQAGAWFVCALSLKSSWNKVEWRLSDHRLLVPSSDL